jgi:hypothetical protein
MSLIKVELEKQVVEFVRSLAPEPRQAIRRSLKNLENEEGDIRALEGEQMAFTACGCFAIGSFSSTV